ncbi:MAG: hypothetical protein NAOJABEB_03079 [Steroidobacteraceae bacterium]|nr:hypothetical protein [Steroidobacteraceae bacterium]
MAASRFAMPPCRSASVFAGSGCGGASSPRAPGMPGSTAAGGAAACGTRRGSRKNTRPSAIAATRSPATRPVWRRRALRAGGSGTATGATTTSSAGPAAPHWSCTAAGSSIAIVPPSPGATSRAVTTIGAVLTATGGSGGGSASSLSASDSIVTVSCRQACSSSMTARIVAGRPSRVLASIRITSAMRRGGAARVGFSSGAGSSSTRRVSKCG